MCNCIEDTIQQIKANNPHYKEVVFRNQDLISNRLFSELQVKIDEKKIPSTITFRKQPKITILHSYCPFCGEKYKDKENDANV